MYGKKFAERIGRKPMSLTDKINHIKPLIHESKTPDDRTKQEAEVYNQIPTDNAETEGELKETTAKIELKIKEIQLKKYK